VPQFDTLPKTNGPNDKGFGWIAANLSQQQPALPAVRTRGLPEICRDPAEDIAIRHDSAARASSEN
jgi:hypothetical protein